MRRFWRCNGLSIVLLGFFLLTLLAGQFVTGRREFNAERAARNLPPVSAEEYWRSSHFLEATAENWESEFLAIGSMVLLSIFLREKGSPESKPVNLPHADHEE